MREFFCLKPRCDWAHRKRREWVSGDQRGSWRFRPRPAIDLCLKSPLSRTLPIGPSQDRAAPAERTNMGITIALRSQWRLEFTIPDQAVLLQQFIDSLLLLGRDWQSTTTKQRQTGLRLHQQSRVSTPPERLDLVPPKQCPVLPEPALSNLEPSRRHDQPIDAE